MSERTVTVPNDAPRPPSFVSSRLDALARQLFFIVGCGRSGTTLLQVAIANHPDVAMPNETGFYTLIRRRNLSRLGELDNPESFRCGFRAAMEFWRIKELGLDEAALWKLCERENPSWETIFLAILAAVAARGGKSRVGEKSPGHVHYLGLLSARFPSAKFIHIVRDPRAVALSQRRAPFGSRFVGAVSHQWKGVIAAHIEHGQRLGSDRYHLVRYEELVSEPGSVMERVCRFLDLSFSAKMLEHDKRESLGFAKQQIGHMQNTMKPIFTSSIQRWRDELSSDQIAIIEHDLGDEMRLMGYSPTGVTTHLPGLRSTAHRGLNLFERAWRKAVIRRFGTGGRG